MADFEVNAKPRADVGKGASRRLRRLHDQVPGIVYGGCEDPLNVALDHNQLLHATEDEAFFAHVLKLNVEGGKSHDVVVKDLQRHPAKARILHIDFLRVRMDQEIEMTVPLHFVNEDSCPGVKLESGEVQHHITEIDIKCLPGNLPEFIEVDVKDLHLDDSIRLGDLVLPEGVASSVIMHAENEGLEEHEWNQPVVSVHKVHVQAVEDDDAEEAPEAPEATAQKGDDDDAEGDDN